MKVSTYSAQVAAQLVAGGVPDREARLIADLATHAVNEAIAAMARVLRAGDEFAHPIPFNLRGVAYGVAAGAFHALRDELMEQGRATGMEIQQTECTLKGGRA